MVKMVHEVFPINIFYSPNKELSASGSCSWCRRDSLQHNWLTVSTSSLLLSTWSMVQYAYKYLSHYNTLLNISDKCNNSQIQWLSSLLNPRTEWSRPTKRTECSFARLSLSVNQVETFWILLQKNKKLKLP